MAGLACGAFLSPEAGPTVILEKKSQPGRKLLLSGSGQCNVTHVGDIRDFPARYGGHDRFVKPALRAMTNEMMMRFFEEGGVPLVTEPNGKVFPASRRSRDILDALLVSCRGNGTEIRHHFSVDAVEKTSSGFRVRTDSGEPFETTRLVLATGGCSYPATGSNGDGYRLAESLGHPVTPPRPALSPVLVRNFPLAAAAGIGLPQATIALLRNGRKVKETTGDLLLTHRGLSGPVILDLSRYLLPNDQLRFSLIPDFRDAATLESALLEIVENQGRRTLKTLLGGLGLPDRLAELLLKQQQIPTNRRGAELIKAERRIICQTVTEMTLTVESLGGWNEAMATAGGVALEHINPKTLESRLVPGLFFCGELLDVDGDCGGFNMQFAFSSGYLVAVNTVR